MPKISIVQLSEDQRGLLYVPIQQDNAPAHTVRRAHTLLLADEQQPTQTIPRYSIPRLSQARRRAHDS
jgi:hypothetical protein